MAARNSKPASANRGRLPSRESEDVQLPDRGPGRLLFRGGTGEELAAVDRIRPAGQVSPFTSSAAGTISFSPTKGTGASSSATGPRASSRGPSPARSTSSPGPPWSSCFNTPLTRASTGSSSWPGSREPSAGRSTATPGRSGVRSATSSSGRFSWTTTGHERPIGREDMAFGYRHSALQAKPRHRPERRPEGRPPAIRKGSGKAVRENLE